MIWRPVRPGTPTGTTSAVSRARGPVRTTVAPDVTIWSSPDPRTSWRGRTGRAATTSAATGTAGAGPVGAVAVSPAAGVESRFVGHAGARIFRVVIIRVVMRQVVIGQAAGDGLEPGPDRREIRHDLLPDQP